tara:strand:- start:83726 stop:84196 length:471 start_codon:yes stop_codon:yes gene_type:complete
MYPMTKEGEALLREELRKLKTEDRISVVDAIATAREFGDLKENAEYHAAKEQQGLIESRIREIEEKLSKSQVIDISTFNPSDKVIFGTTISLIDLENENEVTYKIVGEDEADTKEGKLSVSAPIAKALIGKYEGDIVKVLTPNGSIEYEISSVEYK